MKKFFSACAAIVILAGCSGTSPRPAPYYAAPIVDVTEGNVQDYWQATRNRYAMTPEVFPNESQPCSFVKVRFTIDSNGNTFDPEILETWPNDRFVADTKKLVALREFRPVDGNPERVPVRTEMTTLFTLEEAGCEEIRSEFESAPTDGAS